MVTLASPERMDQSQSDPREIEVPAPTAWPFVLAFGSTLLFAGLVTSSSVSVLGAVLAVAGCVGWFWEVFPHEHEVTVPVFVQDLRVSTERRVVERLPVAADQLRAWLPVHTYPVSAGVKGGLAGSVAMAVLACAYGVLKIGSIWYPINLLAASVYAQSLKLGPEQLKSFHTDSFLIALGLHALVSTLVGVLYGAMLPMFPRRPIILGGLIAPVLWSGLLYTILGLLNPLLASHIDWYWFFASQAAFGIVAGLVVVRQSRISQAYQRYSPSIVCGCIRPRRSSTSASRNGSPNVCVWRRNCTIRCSRVCSARPCNSTLRWTKCLPTRPRNPR